MNIILGRPRPIETTPEYFLATGNFYSFIHLSPDHAGLKKVWEGLKQMGLGGFGWASK